MKAAQINDYGDATVVTVNEVAIPSVSKGNVIVEVYAASLNPFDTMVRAGLLKDSMPLEFPVTLGGDIAGTISDVGETAQGFAVGDRVYGQANVVAGNSGAFAEYAETNAGQIAKIPGELAFEHAAALPLVGVSALQAVIKHLNLQAGQRVCINGGSGAIGSIAIQIAKNIGASVTATASGDGLEAVRALGADEVIDYTNAAATEALHDFDALLDTAGNRFNDLLRIVRSGGRAVTLTIQPDQNRASELGVEAIYQQTQVTTESLDQLSRYVGDGIITARVGKVFPLSEVTSAFESRENGNVSGKIVLDIKA